MFVVPKNNLKIPDPDMQDYLPPEGREVTSSPYWLRRLKDGDVQQGKAASTRTASTQKPASTGSKT